MMLQREFSPVLRAARPQSNTKRTPGFFRAVRRLLCLLLPSRLVALILAATAVTQLHAEQFELFTYGVVGDTVDSVGYPEDLVGDVAITDYPEDAIGEAVIPAEIDGKPVTSIGWGAFSSCSSLTSITIPDSVTYISYWAFSGCSSLTSIAIPDSVTTIGYSAFSGCTSLTSITIPDSVTEIGSSAFSGCSSLTSIAIPDSVTEIGWLVFEGCSSLTNITVDDANANYSSLDGVLFNKDLTTLVTCLEGRTGSYTIPDSVTAIGSSAFYGCSSLTNVSISEGVGSISEAAFAFCERLATVKIPSTVTHISTGYSSWSLIPRYEAPPPDASAFAGCSGLKSIEVVEGNQNYSSRDGVLFDAAQTRLILCPEGKSGVYTIPDGVITIDGVVRGRNRSSGSGAFRDCKQLTKLTIPNSVTGIGWFAFEGCSSLTSITIPDSVTEIGREAFSDCTGLTSAVFLGDAPGFGGGVFDNTAPNFTIYYPNGSAGFSSPTWKGYPTTKIDDGPVLDDSNLSISYLASIPEVNLTAQTSTNLRNWETEGVTLSEIGDDNRRTASVNRDAQERYLRLVVGDE